jgi:hypothetical protein
MRGSCRWKDIVQYCSPDDGGRGGGFATKPTDAASNSITNTRASIAKATTPAAIIRTAVLNDVFPPARAPHILKEKSNHRKSKGQ